MKIKIVFLLITTLLTFGCGNRVLKHYYYINKGNEYVVAKNYRKALHNFEKANSIISSNLFSTNLNAFIASCFLGDTLTSKKYLKKLSRNLKCSKYLDELKVKCNLRDVYRSEFKESDNYFNSFLDSLINEDQYKRDLITSSEKIRRDSLNMLHFIKFSIINGFPNELTTKINCFTSGTGTDLYRLNLLLLHFKRYKNKTLDSILLSNYEMLNISPAVFANSSQDLANKTRFSNAFIYINNEMYIANIIIQNKEKINSFRKEFGLPSLKQEYELIKNYNELIKLGFHLNINVISFPIEKIPEEMIIEEKFKHIL